MGCISSFRHFGQATSFSYNAVLVQSWVVLQGAAKEDHIELFLSLFFSGEVAYPLEDEQGGLLGIFLHLWHQANHLPSLIAQFQSRSALFLEAVAGRVH